jgi:hypothetical protein
MIDWQKLKREVQIFIAAVVFSLLLAGALLFMYLQAADHWKKSSNLLRQANLRYQIASDQKLLLALYQQRFTALKNRNVLGDEQRIDWVETIQSSSKQHIIPSVKFSLDQRMAATLPDDVTNIAVYVSKMRLDMNLLHEGDLYNLLADLDTRANGLYGISRCNLKQTARKNVDDALSNNLNGICELNWYTMGEVIEQQYDENGEPVPTQEPMMEYNAGSDDI